MLVPKECGSLQDISFDFVNCLYGDQLDAKGREQTFLAFHLLLKNGWTVKELYYVVNEYLSQRISEGNLLTHIQNPNTDIINIFSNRKPSKINLLDPSKTYFHNQLRIYPAPAKVEIDYNTGTIDKETVDYYLEFRGSYTMEEVCNYFLTKNGMYDDILIGDYSRLYGALNWVYKKYQDPELILYMIDAANNQINSGDRAKLINPSNIQDYYTEAMKMREFKLNECSMNGDVKVVPRKRLLSNRSWILDRQKEQEVL